MSHSCLERTNGRENGEAQTRSGERKQEKRRIIHAHTLVQPCGAIGSQFIHLPSGFADRLYWGAITSCLRHRALIHLTTGAALDGSYCSVAESCGVSDCKCTERNKKVRGGFFLNRTTTNITNVMFCEFSSWHREFVSTKPLKNDTLLFAPLGRPAPRSQKCPMQCIVKTIVFTRKHHEDKWDKWHICPKWSIQTFLVKLQCVRLRENKEMRWITSHPRWPRAAGAKFGVFAFQMEKQTIPLLLLYNFA